MCDQGQTVMRKPVSFATCDRIAIRKRVQRIRAWLFLPATRPLRFICTGGSAGLIQLCLLEVLTQRRWAAAIANVIAFLLAAQVNFLLSLFFTWRDRQAQRKAKPVFLAQWLAFHSSIGGTALLNQLVFIVVRLVAPTLLASALAIAITALVNFITLNNFVFRPKN
jgi:putative flippase GtrA